MTGASQAPPAAVNPFQVPQTEPGSREPLCPWLAQEHENYYVDVGDTGSAFTAFKQRIGSPERLTAQGRLVVVQGETGCGKTSLIHRCANYVDAALNRRPSTNGLPEHIVNLTTHPGRPTSANRLVDTCRTVLDRLRKVPGVSTTLLDDPVKASADDQRARYAIQEAYRAVADAAEKHRFVVIVLLPPARENMNDLSEYSLLARTHGRIVFFAESTWQLMESFLDQELQNGAPTVGLQVGPVTIDEGATFATGRIARFRQDNENAIVAGIKRGATKKAMTSIAKTGGPSVRMIQRAFYAAWRERDGQPDPQPVDAYDILAAYLNEISRQDAAGGRGQR